MIRVSTCKTAIYMALAALALLASLPLSARTDPEEEMGRKYAEQVKADNELVEDTEVLERVRRIGEELAQVANSVEVPAVYGESRVVEFDYEFHVIKDEDPNAFSLPGGKVFVNTGLLEMIETDDELAGVLAHEIAHAAHHHVANILREQARIDRYVALVALFGIVSKARGQDLNNMLLGASMVRQGQISGYTMKAEQDADRTAVAYLSRSSYDPTGLVEFMRKLEARHDANPTLPLGIYQTHPAPFRRVACIRKACQDAGVQIDMRELRGVAHARAVEVKDGGGLYEVQLCDRSLYVPASLGPSATSKQRAEEIADAVNTMLDGSVRPEDVDVNETDGTLLIKQGVLIRVEDADLEASSQIAPRALLEKARDALIRAAWADWLVNTCVDNSYEQFE